MTTTPNTAAAPAHTPGPWEKYSDCDGNFMIGAGVDAVICRGIKNEADADLIVVAINCLLCEPKDVWEIDGKTARVMPGVDIPQFVKSVLSLTNNQISVLQWFSTRDWVPHREWIKEMTTVTARSLFNRGLLDVDHSQTTTHYRINNAGRAAIAKAQGGTA